MELLIIIILLSIGYDLLFGELPSYIHPVVWIGQVIDILKKPLIKIKNIYSGFILTLVILLLFLTLFFLILKIAYINIYIFIIVSSLILFTTFAIKMLLKTASDVNKAVNNDIKQVRSLVSYLVSRNTSKLSKEQLLSATVESLTENINDSSIAPFFWVLIIYLVSFYMMKIHWISPFFVIAAPILMALFYRCLNTLDAMVGYKSDKYKFIGWFPARTDDYLNYIPSRITGLFVIISSFFLGMDWKNSWNIMIRDANNTPSPNSGYPMAAASGALHIQLKKIGVYSLGDPDNTINSDIISDAIKLSATTIFLFLAVVLSLVLLIN